MTRLRGRPPLLLLLLLAATVCWSCTGPQPARHLVLVVFDTLRADRMSVYGHERETTPFLQSISDQLVRYRRAKATAPWTAPSHASIFTGQWPVQHGSQWGHIPLAENQLTLAEILGEQGFLTVGFSANRILSKSNGFHQGFDRFTLAEGSWPERTDMFMAELPAVLDEARAGQRRLFLFLNLMDTHIPYSSQQYGEQLGLTGPPPITSSKDKWQVVAGERSLSDEEWRQHRIAYDAAVRVLDDVAATILAMLQERQMLEDTLVVLTSDHGDGLGMHGEPGHALSVWEEQLAVPLLLRLPQARRGGEVVEELTSLSSLLPTMLDTLGIPRPSHLRSAPGLGQPQPVLADYRSYFSELQRHTNVKTAERFPELAAQVPHRHVLYCGELKLISSADGGMSLYDLAADPDEQRDLAGDPPAAAWHCVDRYRELLAQGLYTPFEQQDEYDVDGGDLEALRAMGYLEE